MNIKLLLCLVFSVFCCMGNLEGDPSGRVPLIEGYLSFKFQPIECIGYTGTWQAVIISPDGEYQEGPYIDCASTDPMVLDISCCYQNFVEIGTYSILIKNNIVGSADINFLDSIIVTAHTSGIPFNVVTFRHIVPSSEGENTQLSYDFPMMTEE